MSSKKNSNFVDLSDIINNPKHDPLLKLIDIKACVPEHNLVHEPYGNGNSRISRDKDGYPIHSDLSQEIRLATIGNVDAGKSSTVGVIKYQEADDGKGKSRRGVFRHQHEIESGRTSDISSQYMQYKNRLYNISDLAGHQKYVGTTLKGIISVPIDAVMLTMSAMDGIVGMSREHFGCSVVLKLNIFVVVTKIEDVPINVYEENMNNLDDIIKKANRNSCIIKSAEDLQKYYDDITRVDDDGNKEIGVMDMALYKKVVPIFLISNITLKGVNLLQTYIFNLQSQTDWSEKKKSDNNVFVIENTYSPKGAPLVVSGTIKYGIFKTNQTYMLGPFSTTDKDGKLYKGVFYPIKIRNIRDNYEKDILEADAGISVCFNIATKDSDMVTRATIRKGMCITTKPISTRTFMAKIKILHHSTSIKVGYEPYIHIGGSNETIKIMEMDKEYIRMGQSTIAKLMFKHRYCYIDDNDKFIFREGRTRGIGEVIKLLD